MGNKNMKNESKSEKNKDVMYVKNSPDRKSSKEQPKPKRKMPKPMIISIIVSLCVLVVLGATLGIIAIAKNGKSDEKPVISLTTPESTWNSFVSCVNTGSYDLTKDLVYYLSDDQEENYSFYTNMYSKYSKLTTTFEEIKREGSLSIGKVTLKGKLKESGKKSRPSYEYNVYFVKNASSEWKLLSPINMASGNDDSYEIDTTNNFVYSGSTAVYYYGETFDELTLPDTIEHISGSFLTPLTTISKSNKIYPSNLKTIEIPGNVTEIGNGAFRNYTTLTNVVISKGVTIIGESAFEGCSNLMSVSVPDTITRIKNYAFQNCTSLTSIVIPSKLSSIWNYVFNGCTSLDSVTFREGIASIGEYAFANCTALKDISIPNSVTTIGRYVFYRCSNLENITIPKSVTSIGSWAFEYCSNLKNVYISDITAWCNIDFRRYDANPLYYANNLYLNNQLVTDLVIPDNVTDIRPYAFEHCKSLTSVVIPAGVTSIGGWAFEMCSNLVSATIPEGVTSIGDFAFGRCYSLASITIPEGVTTIGQNAFYSCGNLTSVTIPSSVTSIDHYAFNSCRSLTGVYITDITAWCNIDFGDNDANPIGCSHNLYLNNQLITDLVIPEGVTNIKSRTFSGCTSMTSVTIPQSVTSIGSSAFWNCTGITSLTIPSSVTEIGSNAFHSCTSLTSVIIPEGVTSIGAYAFYDCVGLTNVIIPKSVTSIGDRVFNGCDNLNAIYYAGTKAEWDKIIISYRYNDKLSSITKYYYIENEADVPSDGDNYWHYVDGVPTKW